MLAEHLLEKLQARLPAATFERSTASDAIVVFPAKHSDVGNLEVYDDGDELTVYVGSFTHVHFNNYDEGLTEAERAERIAGDVVGFVEDILADRIEFYGSHHGGGGCRYRDEQPPGLLSMLAHGKKKYVWSGPIGG